MAKKTFWYCDRCGKEFKRDGFTRTVKGPKKVTMFLYDGLRCFSELEYELCNECANDFIKFIGGRNGTNRTDENN